MADLRRCIGSAKFGIEAHDAPPEEFPTQPSQKDGLGRMCKAHWKQYTTALRKAALARKAANGVAPELAATTARVSNQQRRAAAQAAGKVPAADGTVPGETPEPAARRAKLEAKLAEVGVESDEGQRILEAAGAQEARRRKPMTETVIEAVAFD